MNRSLHSGARRRKGTLYVTVLIVAMLVSVLSWSALMLLGVRDVTRRSNSDLWRARVVADDAIAIALARTKWDSSWQATEEHGSPSSRIEVMDGHGWYVIANASEDLEVDPAGEYLVTGFGTVDGVTAARQVTANSIGVPPEPLEYAVVVGGNCDMGLYDNSLTTDGGARIGGNVVGTGGPVVALPLTIDGEPGEIESLQLAGDWREYYLSRGTKIDVQDLEPVRWYGFTIGYTLRRTVLSTSYNPFGEANPEGIYYIDGGGFTIYVSDCRLEATLMLTNVSSSSVVQGSMHWTSPSPDLPALVVDGACEITLSGQDLRESQAGANFNPAAVPFQGESDNDQEDRYPSRIQGVTYISDNLRINDPEDGTASRFVGTLVVAGQLTVHGRANVHSHPLYDNELPKGFYASYYLQPQGGGFRSVASDWVP